MRCTNCPHAKETTPKQLRFVYCSKFEKEMSVTTQFDNCQYMESKEYEIKVAIQNYCNDEKNHIVAVDYLSMLNHIARQFNVPDFVQDIETRRAFEKEVADTLNDSEVKFKLAELVCSIDDNGGESRDDILILEKLDNF